MISQNVNGLRAEDKKEELVNAMMKGNVYIMFLQELHMPHGTGHDGKMGLGALTTGIWNEQHHETKAGHGLSTVT